MSIGSIPRALSLEFLDNKNNNDAPMSLCQKVRFISTHITLEPLTFVYAVSSILIQLTTTNLNLEKACRLQLHYNTSICDAMCERDKSGYSPEQEIEVQKLVSNMAAFKSVCTGIFPGLLMLFFGSWSDRHGRRKPVILVPLIGECITCTCLYLCSYFFYELPLMFNAFSESIPYSITGGWFCFFVGSYSYVSAISSQENKTVRIGALSMCMSVGLTTGILLSGFLIKPIGYKAIYMSSFIMLSLALVYCLMIVRDNHIQDAEQKNQSFIRDFLDIGHVKNTFKVCFKEGSVNRKNKMRIIMVLSMIITGPFFGEYAVLYLLTRLKFKWNEVDFSYFNGLHFCVQTFGSIFAMAYFSKYLKMDDAMIGCIAVVGKLLACIIYALAPSAVFFYMGAVVDVFHGTVHIVLRSLMVKIVPAEELGQSNSVFAICEAAMPLVFGPLYTAIYNRMLNIFPSSFFFLSSIFFGAALILFGYLYSINMKEKKFNAEIQRNIDQEENLLKKACFNEIKKSIEKLKNIS
ncbi:solute carrier family 46 member 3-like [Coccinella septempunctata]|uniref:solute carrier family 46 member 3-like n=1 Tax=Coccinella septempunctata TaxID=41139 RepID=UPI001D0602F2|nr:solute carrier family 46 member 3-like [Coccinella septempunctata]XP_044746843.1 solute carrier family 46 member 3-like [Coccinella septempunctata]